MTCLKLNVFLLILRVFAFVSSFPLTNLDEKNQEISSESWLPLEDLNQTVDEQRFSKSVFVVASFSSDSKPYAESYGSKGLITVDEKNRLDFLAKKISDEFGSFDYDDETNVSSEPVKINIPFDMDSEEEPSTITFTGAAVEEGASEQLDNEANITSTTEYDTVYIEDLADTLESRAEAEKSIGFQKNQSKINSYYSPSTFSSQTTFTSSSKDSLESTITKTVLPAAFSTSPLEINSRTTLESTTNFPFSTEIGKNSVPAIYLDKISSESTTTEAPETTTFSYSPTQILSSRNNMESLPGTTEVTSKTSEIPTGHITDMDSASVPLTTTFTTESASNQPLILRLDQNLISENTTEFASEGTVNARSNDRSLLEKNSSVLTATKDVKTNGFPKTDAGNHPDNKSKFPKIDIRRLKGPWK